MQKQVENLFRQLPQVDEFLRGDNGRELLQKYPRPLVLAILRSVLADMRREMASGAFGASDRDEILREIHTQVRRSLQSRERSALRPVINATGVILQTNLGRAPLSEPAIERMANVARGYCNLEYDLEHGRRGRRGEFAEDLLLRTTGCDASDRAALIVNNCAAAVLLALNSLAEGREVIVSRGELVEIGGGFRVPEILRKSGARLVEVGTTNRTRIEDYAAAITAETRLILRVHRSNFAIIGFTEQPALEALIELGESAGVHVVEDQGTGCVVDLDVYGFTSGSSFAASAQSAASLVCASGDKLLGGPQCGITVGKPSIVEMMRSNPLYRAFRADKLTYAALEATLLSYLSGQSEEIPAIRMLGLSADSIRERCLRCSEALRAREIQCETVPVESVVGGGTNPNTTLPSFALALGSREIAAGELAEKLRSLDPPVIARIRDGRVLLDLRTVPEAADEQLVCLLLNAFAAKEIDADARVPR
jgi:L-seryl-tRNA(Ser) seleniumtransferase